MLVGGAALVAHDRRDSQTIVADQGIESSATDKLYSELGKKIHINVTSYNRVVLLTGEVLSHDTREQAVNIVRNIPNVRRVHNELVVDDLTSFKSRSHDTWITSKVKSSLVGAKGLDSTYVKVITENDAVYLMGLVTENEADLAVDVARNVEDVDRVVKLFEYVPEPVPEPQPPSQPGTATGQSS
ncbi:MAG: BON domain-containing protein [Gammaproteobacteria bacterium]